ncbi:hypothetical protein [Pseudomonas sp.]|uniref:hypothetical protein n=1 Tax=Pseudomonas sp. TaxID=306 RepID=UPI002632EDEA|nr:hypothetical protein [Pseudomonas sp.]
MSKSPLALNPPRVPAAIANGGLRLVDLSDPGSPVQVQIVLAPGAVQLNHRIDLYWQTNFITSETVNQGHLTAGIVNLSVPPADILRFPDGDHTFYYIATSAIGGGTEQSPNGVVRVKRLVPGGLDPDPGSGDINENLKAPTGIPDVIEDSVQAVTATVLVYDNMFAGDKITLDWAGQRLLHPALEASEVGSPVNFTVTRAILDTYRGSVNVRYEVRDEVNNWSKWSVLKQTEVGVGLRPPTITNVKDSQGIEIPENTKTFDNNVTLSGSAQASGMVEILDQNLVIGAATADTGGTWTRVFTGRADGPHAMKAKALYGTGLESSVRTFTVEVQTVPAPPAPDVLEDNAANVLDLKGLTRVTVRVPNYGMQVGDTVRVRWLGVNLHETAIKTIVAIAPLDFDIPLAWAREDVDKSVTVTYSYARGGPIIVSLPLAISVVETGENLDLIRPEVVGATGANRDQLDFSRLPSGADVTVTVPQYMGMAVGQTVRVRWASRIVFQTDIKSVQNIAPINFTIWRDEVIDSIGRLVDVNYSVVEYTGGPIIASRILSLNVLPQALNLVAPTINAGNTTVSVAYASSLTSHTIAVRWRGVTDRNTAVQHPPSNGGVTQFTIPSQWVTENRGRRVLINYSVGVGDNSLIFSQLLRIDIP